MLKISNKKVLAIIAEYNPFHLGHLYHIQKSIKETNADYIIAIMGGHFTQRGNCSIIDKWSKTQMALQNFVDLVIELPLLYTISSAENFANGAINILNELKIVNYLSFGSETDELSTLLNISKILCDEPTKFKNLLSHELNKGISFPKARENALMIYLNDIVRYSNVLSSPNNILAIEYLKTLQKTNSSIIPISIKRFGNNYNDKNINENSNKNNIVSATAIRNLLKSNGFTSIAPYIPNNCHSILLDNIKNGTLVYDISAFNKEFIYVLRKMSIDEIANLPDVSEGLEFAIKKAANNCNSTTEFLSMVKSKRYTATRLNRILLYALLGITKKHMEISKKTHPYIRVLGFNSKGKEMISEISKLNPKAEIVTSLKKYMDNNINKNIKIMLEKDIFSTDIYTLGYTHNSCSNLDFSNGLIVL